MGSRYQKPTQGYYIIMSYFQFMVNSNLRTIAEGADPKKTIATLRSNGYHKIAQEVENRLRIISHQN
jgi:hypothetical protein